MPCSVEVGRSSPERIEDIARDWARDNTLADLRGARERHFNREKAAEHGLTLADGLAILCRAIEIRASKQSVQALQHVYPQWDTPEDDPRGEPVEVWRGKMRIVHAQRARKLRRRGVPLMDLRPRTSAGYVGKAKYAWFVEPKCERCNDTGVINISYGGDGYGGRCAAMADGEGPCPECRP